MARADKIDFDLGRRIVSSVIREGAPALDKYLAQGWDETWLDDSDIPTSYVFKGAHEDAWRWILRHYRQHHVGPDKALFQIQHPPQSYPLTEDDYSPEELIDVATQKINAAILLETTFMIEQAGLAREDPEAAARHMREAAERVQNAIALAQGSETEFQTLDKVKLKRKIWTWKDFVLARYLNLLVGRPDVGKSTLAAWLAAQITTGKLPGENYGKPRGVLYVATEDSFDDTIAPRLQAAGADLSKVIRVNPDETAGKTGTVNIVTDLAKVKRGVARHDVALIIFDPLVSAMEGTELNDSGAVRPALERLRREVLEPLNVAVIGLMHFRKASADDILSMISGSGAFAQVVRSVMACAVDREQSEEQGEKVVVFSRVKGNLARDMAESRTYTFEGCQYETDEGPDETSRIVWRDDTEVSAGDLITNGARGKRESGGKTKTELCAEWLVEHLRDGELHLSEAVYHHAHLAGFPESTVRKARAGHLPAGMRIDSIRDGYGAESQSRWKLVQAEDRAASSL